MPPASASLPVVAVAFGGAHGGGARPAHQFAELGLSPSPALAEGADIRGDNGGLLLRGLACDATPFRHHPLAFFVSTA